MPPGPLYNWLCVLHTASEIISHAAAIRVAQAAEVNAALVSNRHRVSSQNRTVPSKQDISQRVPTVDAQRDLGVEKILSPIYNEERGSTSAAGYKAGLELAENPEVPRAVSEPEVSGDSSQIGITDLQSPEGLDDARNKNEVMMTEKPMSEPPWEVIANARLPGTTSFQEGSAPGIQSDPLPITSQPRRNLQASRVPSSRIGRLFHYGGLAASLGYGVATEALRRVSSSNSEDAQTPLMMSSSNVSRLVEKLSKMRGAALKLGQFMSIQDSHLLPKDVEEVFRRVQDSAHYMPHWQMERVMSDSLGPQWMSNFSAFDPIPFAAASLGQVHSAVLSGKVSPTGKDEKVAVKIQFPDIAKSIDSDLGYLKLILTAGSLLPKGLFLDKTLKVMKGELADECDYSLEATSARFFSSPNGLGNDPKFRVPWVWNGSTNAVLVMQHMDGVSVGGNVVDVLSQDTRDEIATRILDLCMKELFTFRMMQTDPNWSNFLWNEHTKQIELIDFGATRSYTKEFIDKWMHVLQAAVSENREECIRWSLELGYLTGGESESMLDAHVRSLMLLATPFRARMTGDNLYSFGRGSEWAKITAEIRSLIPIMLNERLTPPPRETYSLNRKLSGAFLLASRLSAKVDCRSIWERTVANYEFD